MKKPKKWRKWVSKIFPALISMILEIRQWSKFCQAQRNQQSNVRNYCQARFYWIQTKKISLKSEFVGSGFVKTRDEDVKVHSFLKQCLHDLILWKQGLFFTKPFQASPCWHQLKDHLFIKWKKIKKITVSKMNRF